MGSIDCSKDRRESCYVVKASLGLMEIDWKWNELPFIFRDSSWNSVFYLAHGIIRHSNQIPNYLMKAGCSIKTQVRRTCCIDVDFTVWHPILVSNRENTAATNTTTAAAATTTTSATVAIVATTTTTSTANASTNTTATKNFTNLLVWQWPWYPTEVTKRMMPSLLFPF